jgi:MarR family transcriptional regulator, transcriptional regulator for hemolysin
MNILEKQKYIFSSMFLLANRLQVIGDQYMDRDGITTKQWFLTVMISQLGENSPTLGEVADLMGSSRQNVKQLALKLEEKEFLKIEQDEQDARAIRLKLTNKSQEFWGKRECIDNQFIKDLFKDFSHQEISIIAKGIDKLFIKIEKMGKSLE